jgi:flagellar motility protein MotE (MotC chaperone)
MIRHLLPPRLLPVTTGAIVLLFACKSVDLVRVALFAAPPDASPTLLVAPAAAAPAAPAPQTAPAVQPPAAQPPAAAADPPPITDSERAVLTDLRHRREALEAREQALTARESVLAAAERRLSARVEELQALQTRLEALESERHDRDEANWRGLVKVYETMRPRDAAAIFNDLDMAVLLQVVDRMREAKAAPVLAAMQPDKARTLTAQLAELRTRRVTPAPAPSAPAPSALAPSAPAPSAPAPSAPAQPASAPPPLAAPSRS